MTASKKESYEECTFPHGKCAMHDRLENEIENSEIRRESDRKLISYIPQILDTQNKMIGGAKILGVGCMAILTASFLFTLIVKQDSWEADNRLIEKSQRIDDRINNVVMKRIDELASITTRNEQQQSSVLAELRRLNQNLERDHYNKIKKEEGNNGS